MANLIVYLIVFPLLFWIGLFYVRLARGLRRAVRRVMLAASPAAGSAELPRNRQYEETALATARAILHQFSEQPDMPEDERLAHVTYAIVEAMHRLAERRQAGTACVEATVD